MPVPTSQIGIFLFVFYLTVFTRSGENCTNLCVDSCVYVCVLCRESNVHDVMKGLRALLRSRTNPNMLRSRTNPKMSRSVSGNPNMIRFW